MKNTLLVLVLIFFASSFSASGMLSNKSSGKESDFLPKSKQQDIHDFLKKKRATNSIIYAYFKNGQKLQGMTSRIYCPGLNHKIIIPCEKSFAILLKASNWRSKAQNSEFISEIAHLLYYEPDEPHKLPYNAFIFRTTQQKGHSQLEFQDLDKNEEFIVTIINN